MAGKPQPLILEKGDFRIFLFAQMRIRNLAPQQFAEELGVSISTMYALLSGEEQPSDELAKKVGLRQVWVIDNEVQPKAPKPKK